MIQFFTTYTLGQVQTVLALVLSILGIGWLFFISSVVKFRALRSLRQNKNDEIPILGTIVPHNVVDVFRILRIKVITPVVVISVLVILGIILTSFEGIIVINTVHYVESCKTSTVISQALMVNDTNPAQAISSSFEVEAMMKKRKKSGVPDGILVGQIPKDDRWKFNAHWDVDPYPCRGSCSLYKSAGVIQVNMNTSILHLSIIDDLLNTLPAELHAEYKFGDFNFSAGDYNVLAQYLAYYNKTSATGTEANEANGSLITIIEEFKQGNFNTTGAKYINRMWTLRVPENIRIPRLENQIVSAPMFVKVYTCELERVKEGNHGSYNGFAGDSEDLSTMLSELFNFVGRKWQVAIMNGFDASIYELTPEHWASYLAVRDTQIIQEEEVPAQIDMPCISIHPVYILLVIIYIIMIIIGCIFELIIYGSGLKIPSGPIEWTDHICKGFNGGSTDDGLASSNLVVHDKKSIKVVSKKKQEII